MSEVSLDQNDSTVPTAPGGRLSTGDAIALTALALSVISFGWQVVDVLRGPDVNLLSIEDRVIEFRCIGSREACWDSTDGSSPAVSVIAPVFSANLGASEENEVLRSAELSLAMGDVGDITLVGHAFWEGTSAGAVGDRAPFEPIFVPGGGVEGEEVRFTPFTANNRFSWSDFADAVIDGSIEEIELTLLVTPLIEPRSLMVSCTAAISERARERLTSRREGIRAPYLSIVCGD